MESVLKKNQIITIVNNLCINSVIQFINS